LINMTRIAIFPGSFDPYTKGHHDIVTRGLALFDKIVVAIGHNTKKNDRHFDVDMMIRKIKDTYQNEDRVEVIVYNELTATLASKYDAKFLLRGLRNTTDFEYENSISQINSHLNQSLESVFLITSPEFAYISSTIIREVHKYGGDISNYLPYNPSGI
jgi:pantetheine-phosphate adenylyltransferase